VIWEDVTGRHGRAIPSIVILSAWVGNLRPERSAAEGRSGAKSKYVEALFKSLRKRANPKTPVKKMRTSHVTFHPGGVLPMKKDPDAKRKLQTTNPGNQLLKSFNAIKSKKIMKAKTIVRNRMLTIITGIAVMLFMSVSLSSCDNAINQGADKGTLKVVMVDAPGNYEEVWVHIVRVEVNNEQDEDTGWIVPSVSPMRATTCWSLSTEPM
jgi:hypothetical protein